MGNLIPVTRKNLLPKILKLISQANRHLGTVEIAKRIGESRKVTEARLVQLMAERKICGFKISSGGHGAWIWWCDGVFN